MTKNLSLRFKIVGATATVFFIAVGCIVSFSNMAQRTFISAEIEQSAGTICDSIYNGMVYPMSVGDDTTIKQQMGDIKKRLKYIEVFIFGFDKSCSYSSEKEMVGADVTKEIHSGDLMRALDQLLQDGKTPNRVFKEYIKGKAYLTVLRSIVNADRCSPCHGTSRSVLGGMMVRQNMEMTSSNLVKLRNSNIIIGIVACLIVILVLPSLISRFATQPVHQLTASLSKSAGQVASASTQIASASQSLAKSVSERTVSWEGTSATMEEISSMTNRNAELAQQAKRLSAEALTLIDNAAASMNTVMASMREISDASEETATIIKTIDEIAFQTNLLAINATVEAARAGRAGAGFAVVAQEVRNLAQRAADAAKNTANLIEGAVITIKTGQGLVKKTGAEFIAVETSSREMGELVEEIAGASWEGSHGIQRINTALQETDNVFQQNAAHIAVLASSAQELNARAEQLKATVKQLVATVRGHG